MNEATLEARLNAELQRIFPTLGKLSISHQDIFTLQFGHKSVTINGRDNDKAFGRYDVLIKIDEKPVILFELKRPGKELLPEDRGQGVSYARLLDPMPPLVVISNGQQTEFYTTHDKQPWVADTLDERALKLLISQSLSCAAAEKDEAVRLLLGQQPQIWTHIIRQFTNDKILARRGEVSDLTYPLVKDFSLPRKIVNTLVDQLLSGKRLIALIGPPLSGKSNIVSQLCDKEIKGIVPLYIDCSSLHYGIFQHLSNIFAHELFRASSIDEVRNWLLNGLRDPVNGRLVIILDGWSTNVSDQIRADIESIIEICKDKAVSILIATDDYALQSITTVSGRPTKTELGQKVVKFGLEPLDDKEFEAAREYFFDRYRVVFHHGAQYNEEYRYPRILRIIAAEVSGHKSREGTVFFIPSVTSVNFLDFTWHCFAQDPMLRVDFKILARAFANDKPLRDTYPSLSLVSHGRGYITHDTAERELGSDRLNRLLSQDHVTVVNFKSDSVLVIPKIPELLASAASYYLADELLSLLAQERRDEAYEYLVRKASAFPYGDIVAAIAIIEVTKKQEDFLTFIIYKLIEDRPKIEKLPKKFRGLIDIPNVGTLPIQGDALAEGNIISNYDPWLILSHLANIPLASQDGSRDIQLALFDEIGSFPEILRRPDSISNKIMKKFHVHEISEIGTILCHQTGIVEPITQAILRGFYEIPKGMIRLCNHAIKEKKLALLWRLYTAAKASETCADPVVQKSSKEAIEMVDPLMESLFKDILGSRDSPKHC